MKIIYLLLPVVLLCACGQRPQGNSTTTAIAVTGDTISIGQDAPILSKLKIAEVVKSPYFVTFSTSGVVKAIPANYAEVASPFAGRVVQSFVKLGQKVSQGSPVFAISSPDYLDAGKNYYQAKQEMELALKNLDREKDLHSNKVGVLKELEEAEVTYELRKKEFENAEAVLSIFRANTDEQSLGQPLIVSSPISGEVITDKIVIGQYLKEDAEPVAVVANLNQVWVSAHVREKDLSLLNSLEAVEVRLNAMPEKAITGKVVYISGMLNEETRSVEVIILCDNAERLMKPGLYAGVRLSDRETDLIRIPAEAILQGEDVSYVLVPLNNNRFVKRKITVGSTEDGKTIVTEGLRQGEQIVVAGAFYLLDAR
ncbi:MAG: efflux RND transporter periplasmic adaptor subunit [Bacteroidales bacterium]|jgi:cobalt-zinc-cadmium efflux system membrane fusion protein|nr:efflux RND transporter periplasmic adaptor subunit [Bacteroidales bacterium]